MQMRNFSTICPQCKGHAPETAPRTGRQATQKALSAEQPSLNFPLVEDEHARNEQNADVKQPVSDDGEPIERSVLDLGSGIDDRILDVIVREVRHDANHKLSDRLH